MNRRMLVVAIAMTWATTAGLPSPGAAAENAGAFWSFRKPVRPAVPDKLPAELNAKAWIKNPIDAFIRAKLAEKGLQPTTQADKRTLIRRASFDLLGLPPAPERVEKFVNDPAPDAYARLINELLESPHYGERWARHWLDVARYADSGGYETDIYYRNAWRYRDYVVKSFNDDKPYDVFVQEQIAGDELWPDNLDLDPRRVYFVSDEKRRHLEARIATGFAALGPRVHESGLDAKRLAYETLTDQVDTLASAFTGLTLGCARCHDHKFDPFTQADYFSLQAIYAAAREVELPLWNSMDEADWRQNYPRIMTVEEARTAYRLFEAQTQGKPLSKEQQARKQELLNAIAQAVLSLPEKSAGQGAVDYVGLMHIPTANVLEREHPALIKPVYVLKRGELQKPGRQAHPALPASLAKETNSPTQLSRPFGSRKELALWLTKPDHPLTARVMVNRIWQWHFGRGIVETPNDFGAMGQPPSHPELLDWLATGFVAGGWKIKDLHRLIMNSATYQQNSSRAERGEQRAKRQEATNKSGDPQDGAGPTALGSPLSALCSPLVEDPDNRLLGRMNRRRLEAEALWDAVHASAGTLNLALGGRPVIPPLAADEIASLRDKWHWVVSVDPAQHTRRGIYILVRRNFKFPMFEVFDSPVTSVSCPTRDVTTVAPQALWGLNNKSVFRQAMHFAGRVVKEAGQDRSAEVNRAWRIALGRPPTADESASAVRLMESLEQEKAEPLPDGPKALQAVPPGRGHALSKLCLALFNLSEFAFID